MSTFGFAQRLSTAGFIGILALSLILNSCSSPESKYQDACRLIGEMKFEEAKDALAGVDKAKLKKGDPSVAMQVCEAGLLAEGKKYDEAYEKMCETGDNDRYKVVISPDDPLHLPALNLALWIKAKRNEPIIKEMLEVDPESDSYGNFFTDANPSQYAEEVLNFGLPEYDKNESFEGGDFSLPRIMCASFKSTKVLPDYAEALKGVQDRYEKYLDKLNADAVIYWAWYYVQQNQRLEQEKLDAQYGLNSLSDIENFLMGAEGLSVFHSQWYEVRGRNIRTVLRFGRHRSNNRLLMQMILVKEPINERVGSVVEEVAERWQSQGRTVTLTFQSGEDFTFKRTGTHSFTSEAWEFNRTASMYNYATQFK